MLEKNNVTSAILIVPMTRNKQNSKRNWQARLVEAEQLARSIDLKIIHSKLVTLYDIRPATLLGKGKVEEIKNMLDNENIKNKIVIIDYPLTPTQQRNLERQWQVKTIDRTGLILEIFGKRAQTKEGRLQVELAQLMYQKGRLVRVWTHLERQRAAGTVGGPGETQIESDRRQISQKIKNIEKAIAKVRNTRTLQRRGRQKVPYPIVALVGYTNSGKSTLFNRLTKNSVLAKNMLFATLDPKLARLNLGGGSFVLLSDTVGFISDLPTHLIAAFRATLEEVLEADLILHVRDIASEDSKAQSDDVYAILQSLGIANDAKRIVEVWNKIDLLEKTFCDSLLKKNTLSPIVISARQGTGLDNLISYIKNYIKT